MKPNKSFIFLFYISLSFFLLNGCAPKLVEVDIPNQKYSVVVNALLIKDSLISLKMSKNVGVLLKNKNLDSNQIQMKIRINGGNNENLIRPKNKYLNSYFFYLNNINFFNFISPNNIIKNGDEIDIEASAQGFETEYVKFKFEMDDVDAELGSIKPDLFGYNSFTIDISNYPSHRNGFIIELFSIDSLKNYQGIPIILGDFRNNSSPDFLIQNEEYINLDGKYLFDNEQYKSNSAIRKKVNYYPAIKKYEIVSYDTIRFSDGSIILQPNYGVVDSTIFNKNQLAVKITKVDENYLKYVKSASLQIQNQSNIFSEPVFVFSNLPSGKGIIGKASKKLIYFK